VDQLLLYGQPVASRLLLGTARYPSPEIMLAAIAASGSQLVTLSLRRQQSHPALGNDFSQLIRQLGIGILPNTAGCETASEAITLALMSREVFDTKLIKLEIIGDTLNLHPDPFETVACAKQLLALGFQVLPYCTDDLVFCQRLVEVGCEVIMPLAAPIGSGRGLMNPYALEVLRRRLSDITLIVDAGLGRPSDAVMAMEMGCDAVLVNTAIAQARQPALMADAFRAAVAAGRMAHQAVPMIKQDFATPSTPLLGMPFRG